MKRPSPPPVTEQWTEQIVDGQTSARFVMTDAAHGDFIVNAVREDSHWKVVMTTPAATLIHAQTRFMRNATVISWAMDAAAEWIHQRRV